MNAPAKISTVDTNAIRWLAEQLVACAGDQEGDFCLATISDNGDIQHYTVPNGPGAAEKIVALVGSIGAAPHQNVYFSMSLFKSGSIVGNTGRTEKNVVAVLGAVCDFDDKHDPKTRKKRLPLEPSSEVETSPGNYQSHYWFYGPSSGTEAKPVQAALASSTGADACKTVEHLWRMPGTHNWPTEAKIKKGRPRTPFQTHWEKGPDTWNCVSLEALSAAIAAKSDGAIRHAPGVDTTKTEQSGALIFPRIKSNRTRLDHLFAPGEQGTRSEASCAAIRYLVEHGHNDAEILEELKAHPGSAAWQHFRYDDHARDDIRRNRDKCEEKRRATQKDLNAEIAELNCEYAVTCMAGKTFVMHSSRDGVLNRRRIDYFTKANFFDALANRYIADLDDPGSRTPLAPFWFKHSLRRQYLGGVALAPLKDTPEGVFNLWQGFSAEPEAGDWSLLKNHILENICSGNQELFNYLMNWLARMIQAPGSPGEVAIVLRGKKGVGKGIVGKFVGQLLNDHFIHALQADHVTGKFNGHLGDCVFLFADEAFFAGNSAHEKILNGLITETTRLSEEKFLRAVMVPNYIHMLISTNSEWAVPATTDERRYFVLDVSDARMQDTEYFGAIDRQMKSAGLAAMLYELQHRDISKFEVRRVPVTEALTNQKRLTRAGRSGTLGWLEDVLTARELGSLNSYQVPIRWEDDCKGPAIGCNRVFEMYEAWQIKHRRGNVEDRTVFGRKLKEALGDAVDRVKGAADPVTGYRAWLYKLASLGECRRAFMKTQNSPGLWANEDD